MLERLKQLFRSTKGTVEERANPSAIKEDVKDIADIAKNGGSVTEKAKDAADVVRGERDKGVP